MKTSAKELCRREEYQRINGVRKLFPAGGSGRMGPPPGCGRRLEKNELRENT
jgi:hypothetical protein